MKLFTRKYTIKVKTLQNILLFYAPTEHFIIAQGYQPWGLYQNTFML